MPLININTDEVVAYTNKLEKLKKSDFPVVVNQTLNSAAFDVKGVTMPITSKEFVNRSKTFFRANSKVIRSNGFKLSKMASYVGFYSNRLKGDNNFAVRDLEEQEHGGSIGGKAYIPLDGARKSGKGSVVQTKYRLEKIKHLGVNQNKFRGSKRQKFIKAIHHAGKGGYVLGGSTFGQTTLFKVKTLTKKGIFTLLPLYDYKKGRSVRVKPTKFMAIASVQSSKKMEKFYIKHAKARFEKALLR